MGLDMYLTKSTYVKNWNHMKPEELHEITIKGPEAKSIDTKQISRITEDLITWRKSNQIHNWFVKNVQNGEDDCKEYSVSAKQLQELLTTINKILPFEPNKELAEKLLPATAGFFFGSTEYDNFYWEDLKYTKKELIKILKEDPKLRGNYFYQSSW